MLCRVKRFQHFLADDFAVCVVRQQVFQKCVSLDPKTSLFKGI